jgi:hypothetical protein
MVENGTQCVPYLCLCINPNKPFIKTNGVGGQPGITMSTGMTLDTAPQLA